MTKIAVVFVTTPSADKAAEIARALVSEKLAACGNVIPGIRSIYSWQGEVQDDPEALLVLKAPRDRLPELIDRVRALHPYDVPEIIALPVEAGSQPYLDWVRAACPT